MRFREDPMGHIVIKGMFVSTSVWTWLVWDAQIFNGIDMIMVIVFGILACWHHGRPDPGRNQWNGWDFGAEDTRRSGKGCGWGAHDGE